jgi:hypothetical protein
MAVLSTGRMMESEWREKKTKAVGGVLGRLGPPREWEGGGGRERGGGGGGGKKNKFFKARGRTNFGATPPQNPPPNIFL